MRNINHYDNIDEFIAEMLEGREELDAMIDSQHTEEVKEAARKLLTLYDDDCDMLRKMYERAKNPDGSIDLPVGTTMIALMNKLKEVKWVN